MASARIYRLRFVAGAWALGLNACAGAHLGAPGPAAPDRPGYTDTPVALPEAKLAMNWTTASPFSLYANLGYGAIYNEVGRASRAWTSAAAWWSVNPRVSVFVEGLAIGRVSGSGSGTAGNDVDGGVTYL